MKKIISSLLIIGFILVTPKAHAYRNCWGPSFGISYNVGPCWGPCYHSRCNDSGALVGATAGLMTGLAIANAAPPRTAAEIEEDRLRAEKMRQKRDEIRELREQRREELEEERERKRQEKLDARLKKEEERKARKRKLAEEAAAEKEKARLALKRKKNSPSDE